MNFHNLYSVISHTMCKGPVYTYLPDSYSVCASQIDHFLIPTGYCDLVANSLVHEDNTLNTSDHLPISVELNINVARFECMTRTMFNWARLDKDNIMP